MNSKVFFLKTQSDSSVEKYISDLANVGSLSMLFSESEAPYLSSRSCERVFCHAFDATDITRDDSAIDAKYKNIGIGIKTFLHNNGQTYQKIAEFNADRPRYNDLTATEKIQYIARLRNERLSLAERTYGVNELVYHCITRESNQINIYEEEMHFIDIKNIKGINCRAASIFFNDGINEYLFNLSKSTLFKRFVLDKPITMIKVNIIKDVFSVISRFSDVEPTKIPKHIFKDLTQDQALEIPENSSNYVVLPLYSTVGSIKTVMPKSGLNQWNAAGRPRDLDEVYIPISQSIHRKFPGFFPDRDQSFKLILPNMSSLSAKVCQDNSKALMSNPNKDLGKWILREILQVPQGQLLTYQKLEELGIDSVKITKLDSETFQIDFCDLESYDEFATNYLV